jgi:hypothetical protein
MTPTRRRLRLPVLALVLACLPACRDKEGLGNALGEMYGPAIVSFPTTDSTTLRVTFIESPFAGRADAERRGTARKVGEYVRDHYSRYKALDKVTIDFLSKKEMAADTLKHVAASYTFTRAELGPPAAAAAPPADSGVPPGG